MRIGENEQKKTNAKNIAICILAYCIQAVGITNKSSTIWHVKVAFSLKQTKTERCLNGNKFRQTFPILAFI